VWRICCCRRRNGKKWRDRSQVKRQGRNNSAPNGKGSLTDASRQMRPPISLPVAPPDTISPPRDPTNTSGTAPAAPKGAMLTHDNLCLEFRLSLVDYWRFTYNDVLIHALPIYHTPACSWRATVTLFGAPR